MQWPQEVEWACSPSDYNEGPISTLQKTFKVHSFIKTGEDSSIFFGIGGIRKVLFMPNPLPQYVVVWKHFTATSPNCSELVAEGC